MVTEIDAMNVIQGIGLGDYDTYLEAFEKAIRKRVAYTASVRAQSLKVGDRIVLHGLGMGSKYLNGATGTVIGFAIKNIKVEIDAEVNTRKYSHRMRVPPTLLRVLEPHEDPRRVLTTQEE